MEVRITGIYGMKWDLASFVEFIPVFHTVF